MFNLQDLEIKRVSEGSEGRFIFATYSDWDHEYNIFVPEEGSPKGKTTLETWVELSRETNEIVRTKLEEFLARGVRQ